jgi:TetR/AcrR family transcriptional repressor of mexCD-oprJ operon
MAAQRMANELDDKLDEKLAGALALALSRYPRANLQQLARVAGTSKGTLYRICSTREGLIELLVARGERHMRASLEQADLTQPLFAQALQRLTEHLISGAALYMFWSTARWVNIGDIKESEPQGYTPSFFNQALEEFFLRGQKAC